MPSFRLRKSPRKDLYWVVGEDGRKYSRLPIPKSRAEAQRRAIYATLNGYVLDRTRSRSRSRRRSRAL